MPRGGVSRRPVWCGAQKNNPWLDGCTVSCVVWSKADLCALQTTAAYTGEPCVCGDCSAQGMTSASKVPADKSRRGLVFHYKSFHSTEVTGFSDLHEDTNEDTGAEDESVEEIVSDSSSNDDKAVNHSQKDDPDGTVEPDDSGDSKESVLVGWTGSAKAHSVWLRECIFGDLL